MAGAVHWTQLAGLCPLLNFDCSHHQSQLHHWRWHWLHTDNFRLCNIPQHNRTGVAHKHCCSVRASAANKQPKGNSSQQTPDSAARTTLDEGIIGDIAKNTGSSESSSALHSHSAETDWDDWGEDWETSSQPSRSPGSRFRRVNPRRGMGASTPRDEYLRPMIDTAGIQYRLGFRDGEAEERVQTEFETNQWESREAVKFAAILLVVPLLLGIVISRLIANPAFHYIDEVNPQMFEISDRQKVEGAHEIHKAELRIRMDAAIGRAPAIQEGELQGQLRHEAIEIVERFKGRNRYALLNLVSDGITASSGFVLLLRDTEGRNILFRTIGRIFSGLSDTAKAFLIIAATDILLGYHSEEGWTAAIHLITNHYGQEVEEGPIYMFVAIVPVTMDAIFKYWIFKGLNRQNPAAAVTLKTMDRH